MKKSKQESEGFTVPLNKELVDIVNEPSEYNAIRRIKEEKIYSMNQEAYGSWIGNVIALNKERNENTLCFFDQANGGGAINSSLVDDKFMYFIEEHLAYKMHSMYSAFLSGENMALGDGLAIIQLSDDLSHVKGMQLADSAGKLNEYYEFLKDAVKENKINIAMKELDVIYDHVLRNKSEITEKLIKSDIKEITSNNLNKYRPEIIP